MEHALKTGWSVCVVVLLAACGGGGGGDNSNAGNITPPTAPSNVSVTGDDGFNTVQWTSVSGATSLHVPGGVTESAITFYLYARSKSATKLSGTRRTRNQPYLTLCRIYWCGIRGLHAKSGCDGLDNSPDS